MKKISNSMKLDKIELTNKDHNNKSQNIQERLSNEKLFEIGYKDLLRTKPFWLEGKTPKQLKPLMEKYVHDFQFTYGSFPAWYTKPDSDAPNDQEIINLHNFRIEMKFIHENS